MRGGCAVVGVADLGVELRVAFDVALDVAFGEIDFASRVVALL
jgi:hypothetical protein